MLESVAKKPILKVLSEEAMFSFAGKFIIVPVKQIDLIAFQEP